MNTICLWFSNIKQLLILFFSKVLSYVTILPSIYYNNLLKCFLTYQRSLRVTCGNYVCILNVCLVTSQITGMCSGPASVALFSLEPQCNRHLVWSNRLYSHVLRCPVQRQRNITQIGLLELLIQPFHWIFRPFTNSQPEWMQSEATQS